MTDDIVTIINTANALLRLLTVACRAGIAYYAWYARRREFRRRAR